MADKKASAYGAPAGDTDFRKTYDLDEYAAKAKDREAKEKEEAKARYEAKLAGKKYYKPLTGDETLTQARRNVLDLSAQVGKTQLVPAGAGVGKRGRGAGFYCEPCDLTFKDNKQFVEHLNTPQHLANTGQKTEVKRATAEEVRDRIEWHWQRKLDLEKEKATSLQDRLALREEENAKEAEERRKKRKEADERRRAGREAAEKVKTEYGDDVRIEGEHDEDDMMAAMGITGFGGAKRKSELCDTMASSSAAAASLLGRQLKEMQTGKDIPGISCGLVNDNSIFEWEVMLMISDDCKYYGGGNFRARLTFPANYPLMPPSLTFQTPIPFHPNIYPDGRLCISILHPPEEDQYGYEAASERWSPVQSPETILLSTISLFHGPNDESPANVEAARMFREEREGKNKDFRRRCRACVRESLGED
ncbi:hypothetical protein CSAL01_03780 [Colletotrichum salicis]|uniref:UBC core domain-containing protein n=15 Tax=Colletotrichum acutatum species complex TaxID=2707335 RepID=A0A135UZY4_9PEZI|nr:hypothetical protein CSAL01_03780 [Colletotrichum salicis]